MLFKLVIGWFRQLWGETGCDALVAGQLVALESSVRSFSATGCDALAGQESWSKSCPRRFALFHQKLPPSSTAYLQDSHRHNFSWIWVQKSAPLMKMMMSNKRKMYLWWSSKFNCEWLPTTRGKAVKQIGCLDSWQPTRQGPLAWDYKFFSQMLFMVAKGPGFHQITRQQQHLAFKQCSAKMVGCVSDVAINLCLLAKR